MRLRYLNELARGKLTLACILLVMSIVGVYLMLRPEDNIHVYYSFNEPESVPIIFVGGHESSGTGLMRILLDAHPMVRCGGEPLITMVMADQRYKFFDQVKDRSESVGVTKDVVDHASASFILEVIKRMGPPAPILCHKQPPMQEHVPYLARMFPKAKFIHMVRDGRAAIASSMQRGLISKGQDPQNSLNNWERMTGHYIKECQDVDGQRCQSIYYERLVLNPESELRKLMKFLNLPWDPILLKHETIVNSLTHLTPYEPSTAQFKKKIHTDSLSKWAGPESIFSRLFIENSHNNKLLQALGYSNVGIPPDYKKLPPFVPKI